MARDVVIPDAIFPPPADPSGQASPKALNDVARAQRSIQITAAGRDSYIPIIYGGPERTAGLLYLARVYNSKLVLCILLCRGPVEQISGVQMNDADVPVGVTVTTYDGSQVTADATLAAAIPGFAEAMTGTAYAVCQIPAGASQGFPRFTFEVKGLKVYDPRENRYTYANDFANAAWSSSLSSRVQGAAAPDGSATAWTLTDSSAVAYLALSRSYTVPNDGASYSFTISVKKTAGGTAPTFGVNLNFTGGTGVSRHLRLNTDTGVDAYGFWTVTPHPKDPGYWLCTTTIANNSSGNTALLFAIYPATSAYGGGAADTPAATGSAICCRPGMAFGAAPKAYTPTTASAVIPTTAWSENPALIVADYLVDANYGARRTAGASFWNSVSEAADFCDTLVGSPAEKRALLTFTMAEKRDVKDWIETLRSYVPCWVIEDGDVVQELVVDQPRATDHVFTASSIAQKPAPRLFKRGVRDTPTVVEIGYTRTDVKPWAAGYAEATTGAGVRRKARIDMPGIRRHSQARRFAIERLNHYTLEDLEGEIAVFEDGLKVREGDVSEITDDIGLSSKKFRILRARDRGHGRWLLRGREYDPAAYSTVVETTPSSPNTGLPDPRVVQAATSLSITETVYLEKSLSADSLARGLIYQSRFDVSWTASTYAYPCTYRVQILDGAQVIHEGMTPGTTYSSPAVQQGKTYTVKVFTRSGLGYESAALQDSKTAQGKLLAPGDVPAITSSLEIGGEVLLQWTPAVDIDVVRYEWRYGSTSGFDWTTATLIDRVDGLRARFRGLPTGTWRFAVKAIDSVGNYSAAATTVDITVTSDADAFLQDREFVSPTLTNMIEIPALEGVWKRRWATSLASDQWNTVMPNPVNSGANPVFSYHASVSGRWEGESWDFGAVVTGDWAIVADVTVLSGTAIYEIEHSNDGSAWTPETGTSWKGAARFVRPVIRSATSSTLLLNAPPKMTLAAITRRESSGGSVETSLSSGPKTITLSGKYIKAVAINITPRGTAARIATVDNIVLSLSGANTVDVYIFDAAGAQVATDFSWDFEGF